MRNLTKCPDCDRIYDVSNIKEDEKFRCACGTTLKQQTAKGHESNVIRCSNCGGPRDSIGDQCNYCQSEFTLHERDLNTVCPQCFTRVSDKAKFCHSCAMSLTTFAFDPKGTKKPCPACSGNQTLQERNLGEMKIPFSECSNCAGMWLNWDAFQIACQSALRRSPKQLSWLKPKATPESKAQAGRLYRKCPDCQKIMNRVNYARNSGIVVDACVEKNHGLWFDFDELPSVLSWLHQGGVHDRRVNDDLDIVNRTEINQNDGSLNLGTSSTFEKEEVVYVIDEDIDLDAVMKFLFAK